MRLGLTGQGKSKAPVEPDGRFIVAGNHQPHAANTARARPCEHRIDQRPADAAPAMSGSHPHRFQIRSPCVIPFKTSNRHSTSNVCVHGQEACCSLTI
jgi:hypothetical protein